MLKSTVNIFELDFELVRIGFTAVALINKLKYSKSDVTENLWEIVEQIYMDQQGFGINAEDK